jgi:hypothetical protein
MEFEVLASEGRADRVAFWRETVERVLSEGGYTPHVERVVLTDQPGRVPGLEEWGREMESVALAIPQIASQATLLLDVVESDKLLQGNEGQKAIVAAAIVREEGFHARDYATLSRLPRERWAEHVDADDILQNSHGLHSLLEMRVLEDHLKQVPGEEEWFLVHYKVPWAKHVWNQLRNRMLVFRKRHTDLAWTEANAGGLQEIFFRFAETFAVLQQRLPQNVDVVAITRFAEWNRVKDAVAAFQAIYEQGFRSLPEDGTALAGAPLSGRVQEEVLTPWLQKLADKD